MRDPKYHPFWRKPVVNPSRIILLLMVLFVGMSGCTQFAPYPVNEPIKQFNRKGYLSQSRGTPGNSDKLLLILSFSGGGTRAAALAYGLLKELRDREISHAPIIQFILSA